MAHEFIEPGFDQALDLGDRAPRLVLFALDRGRGADADRDFIAGQDFQHFIRRDEDFTTIVRHRESIAVLRSFDGRVDVLILRFEFFPKALELRHRIAIEHGQYRLLRVSSYLTVAITAECASELWRDAIELRGRCQGKPNACFLLRVVDRAVAGRFTEGVRNVESRSPSVPIRAGHSRPRQQTTSSAITARRTSHPQILPTLSRAESDMMPFSRSTVLFVLPFCEEIICR